MRRWELTVALDPSRQQPLVVQLSSAIAEDIRSGRLKSGDPLPGSRELAERLGVSRNTVVASYQELAAEGLVSSQVGAGTLVSTPPPGPTSSVLPPLPEPTYELGARRKSSPVSRPPPHGALMMSRGVPDPRLLPSRPLARAFARAIGQRGKTLLTYADLFGHRRLREELAIMLGRTRGLRVTAETVLVTRGSEHGLDLVARTLLAPGDVVAVEEMGWPTAWSALELAGARLVALPLREGGLDTEALAALASRERVRAVFVTPHRQFPTTAVMLPRHRARLSQLALQHRFAIIEEEEDHEFYYEGKPLLPISASSSNAIYVGSLSNFLTPGLGTGFVFAPPPVLERLAALKAASDPKGDAAVEYAIAELFEDGEMLRQMRRMRRVYRSRRDALADALRRYLKEAIAFSLPDGGMALWARVDDSIDVSEWARAADREGVTFCDSRAYDFRHRDQPFVRLGFTYHDEEELTEAVRRMARALKTFSHARPKVARGAVSGR